MADAPQHPSPIAPRLLVAEDDDGLRGMLQVVLQSAGYHVTLCQDGQAAIDLLASGAGVDAVMMDLRMPRASGDEVLAFIRSTPSLRSLPVIAMSAYGDEQQARALLEAGANAFLSKPFPIAELLSTLQRVLGEGRP